MIRARESFSQGWYDTIVACLGQGAIFVGLTRSVCAQKLRDDLRSTSILAGTAPNPALEDAREDECVCVANAAGDDLEFVICGFEQLLGPLHSNIC